MSVDLADDLQALLERQSHWPPPAETKIHERLDEWAAIYEADAERLREVTGWPTGRTYVPDPLAQKATDAQTNLIYGEDPEITAANESDQDNLDGLAEANDLAAELQHARSMCGAEGEVWWRIVVDREASDYAIVDWHSRRVVFPMYAGRRLLACAFVSELERADGAVWRYVEIHSDDVQRNLLYQGTDNSAQTTTSVVAAAAGSGIGEQRDLAQRPETEDLDDQWLHGLPMLAGRIVNRRGRNPQLGISDYQAVRELLLALNEAQTIGAENARLTLKRRVVVPSESARPALPGRGAQDPGMPVQGAATVDVSEEVLLANPDDEMDSSDLFKVLEYSFDAEALIAYKGDLTDTVLTRMSVAPQLVGRHTEQAQSGAALRARLLDSILAALGKARPWDGEVPRILSLAARVDALPEAKGGLGRSWTDPADPPAVERKSSLPEDATEEAARHVALVVAQIEARETAIRESHPDWDDERVNDELDKIRGDQPAGLGATSNGGGTIRTERPPIVLNGAGA